MGLLFLCLMIDCISQIMAEKGLKFLDMEMIYRNAETLQVNGR